MGPRATPPSTDWQIGNLPGESPNREALMASSGPADPVSPERGSPGYVLVLTVVAALGGLLFGYDTAVISGAIGFLQDHFKLDPQLWKGWAAASALIGCALGAALAGLMSDRLGRKKALLVAAVLYLISAVGTAVPPDFAWFVILRIVGGIGVGAASITSPMYIAEISPARIRGRMVSINQFAIVSGMLIVYFVNFFIGAYGEAVDRHRAAAELSRPAEEVDARTVARFFEERPALTRWNVAWGWRWMFGSEALPAALFLVLLFLVPESPRWLTRWGRRDEAAAILTRVDGPAHARDELAAIEDALRRETGSVWQLFEPNLRMVLVIGVALAVLQQITGINVFLYYAPEIFKGIGQSESQAALLETVIVGAVNMAFTIIAIWTVDWLGRKPLMLIGATGMGISLLGLGAAAYFEWIGAWILIFILGYIACFALSVGPVTWVILAEIFPTQIRGRAMAIATVCLWVANFIVTQTFTMMDEDRWLVATFHHAFPFAIYAFFCLVQFVFVLVWVPETKGKTLEEIERGWLRR